jgi:polysaccharide export outer membrane protein
MSAGQMNRVLSHLHHVALIHECGDLTDAQLLERFLRRHNEIAFSALVRRYGPMVLGVCRRVLAHHHDADDAFQATFLVLVRKAASIRPHSCVGPWLYGVAYRTALKARSSAARRRSAEQKAGRERSLTAPADTRYDPSPLLDEELGRLPEKYRAPVVLCLLQGKSRKAAAGLLGWSEGTLSGRLARAKQVLGERLRRRGVVPAAGALIASAAEGVAAPAPVPGLLVAGTVKAALSLAGPAAAAGISAPVIALMEEVSKAMLMSKLKLAVGVLLLVAGIGVGTGAVVWPRGSTSAPGAAPAEPDAGPERASAPAKKKAKRPDYVIGPPDVLAVEYASSDVSDPVKIAGARLVRPDGTIGLGQLGAVFVAGQTLEEARRAIAEHLARRLDNFDPKKLRLEVVASNSRVFYVVTDGANGGDQVYRLPATGGETVLDALVQSKTLIGIGKKRITVQRPSGVGESSQTLRVDWKAITQDGDARTNYLLQAGDRLHIKNAASKTPAGASEPASYQKRRLGKE